MSDASSDLQRDDPFMLSPKAEQPPAKGEGPMTDTINASTDEPLDSQENPAEDGDYVVSSLSFLFPIR